jgi:hypothetical protein
MKNRYFISGDITVIEIKNRKRKHKYFYTIIDSKNLPEILDACNSITAVVDPTTNYANCNLKEKKSVALHRLILDTPKGLVVDHKNHDGLDNRESNIWNCTRADNNRNRRYHNHRNEEYWNIV